MGKNVYTTQAASIRLASATTVIHSFIHSVSTLIFSLPFTVATKTFVPVLCGLRVPIFFLFYQAIKTVRLQTKCGPFELFSWLEELFKMNYEYGLKRKG
jgi:hypothetical protein